MRPLVLLSIPMVGMAGCSADKAPAGADSPDSPSSQHASLRVVFGATSVELETSAITSTTTSRLLLQSMDADATVFVSLAIPLQSQRIALSANPETASVWARNASMQPLIASSGALVVQTVDGVSSFVFENVAKPTDASSESLQITGTITGITGVSAPR